MADVEAALLAFFDDLAYTATVTPAWSDLAGLIAAHGGVLRIRRIGGGGDRDNDYPTISIQAFAAAAYNAPRAGHVLQQAVEDRFVEVLDGTRAGFAAGVAFDAIDKNSGPVELPSPDPTITVVESVYRLTSRR